jgi:hypothetical protein
VPLVKEMGMSSTSFTNPRLIRMLENVSVDDPQIPPARLQSLKALDPNMADDCARNLPMCHTWWPSWDNHAHPPPCQRGHIEEVVSSVIGMRFASLGGNIIGRGSKLVWHTRCGWFMHGDEGNSPRLTRPKPSSLSDGYKITVYEPVPFSRSAPTFIFSARTNTDDT